MIRGNKGFSLFLLWAAAAIALPAQTFTTLFSFDTTDGENPLGALVQAIDGDFYGTVAHGGTNSGGTVFKITPSGVQTTLYDFCSLNACSDGQYPAAGLVQATNGSLYGTTANGGANEKGTIFKISLSGTLTTLYSFCPISECMDGANPWGRLVQAPNGDLYGTSVGGGASNHGTVFKITPRGTFTTLSGFCVAFACADGASPWAGLVPAANGDFYGTTLYGGRYAGGTIFKITPSGIRTTLYSFCALPACTDGAFPNGGLVQSTNGDFYGTTSGGGANVGGVQYSGTVFKITPGGALTTLYSFCSQRGCPDGENPDAALVQAANGDFYGTTSGPGGTLFKITPSGTLTTLYTFCLKSGCPDGENPQAALAQGTDGDFYGTSPYGGTGRAGTLFRLSVGLSPFVKTLSHAGSAGASIIVLGTDLTGATSVSFNGTQAAFTVVSPTEIMATVPAGATTGKILVTTPGGTLFSIGPFLVLPQNAFVP